MPASPPIDKMQLVNIEGPASLLDDVLLGCADLLAFPAQGTTARRDEFSAEERDPYLRLVEKMERIADNSGIPLQRQEIRAVTAGRQEIRGYIRDFTQSFNEQQAALLEAQRQVDETKNLLVHLHHLQELHISFGDIAACRYVRILFGRISRDSFQKLRYYEEHLYFFFPFSQEGDYVWGAFATTNEYKKELDNILAALFFEQVHIPPAVRGTPQEALGAAEKYLSEATSRLALLNEQFSRLCEENRPKFLRFYNEARYLSRLMDIRKFASVFSDKFYLSGFAPRDNLKKLYAAAQALPDVKIEEVSS